MIIGSVISIGNICYAAFKCLKKKPNSASVYNSNAINDRILDKNTADEENLKLIIKL